MQNFGGTKMIADQNTHPQRQLYYLGARIRRYLGKFIQFNTGLAVFIKCNIY